MNKWDDKVWKARLLFDITDELDIDIGNTLVNDAMDEVSEFCEDQGIKATEFYYKSSSHQLTVRVELTMAQYAFALGYFHKAKYVYQPYIFLDMSED